MNRRRTAGFTMVELLIVLAIIGILAATAVWAYRRALDRSRQKATLANMRAIAQAWEARATDRGGYNAAGQVSVGWPSNDLTDEDITTALTPTYIRPLDLRDGWGGKFEFATEQPFGSNTRATVYGIRSAGRDHTFQNSYSTAITDDYDCDIVFMNGSFVVHPREQ